jgi:hypothetical protein
MNKLQAISKPPLRPNLGVGSRSPILEIVDYYCGCLPRSALIFNLIEGFEMACRSISPWFNPVHNVRILTYHLPKNISSLDLIYNKEPFRGRGYGMPDQGDRGI